MTTMVNAIETDIPTTKLLQDPFRILPLLADSPNDDFAFYSMDKDGRFVYLSKSAEKVLRHDPKEWLGRSFRDALTAAPCNDRIRTTDPIDRNPTCCKLEIFDSDGKRLSLRCWSAPVLENGTFIGKTGLVQRFPEVDSCDLEGHKNDELQSRAGSLTSSEIQVVEMVFEGKLNKTIARELGVSMRTVEARRSKSMKKLGVSSFSELIQLWGKIKARNG